MQPQPIYTTSIHLAYHLRFGWTAWPSNGVFPAWPEDGDWDDLLEAWESDGMRLLEHQHAPDRLQMTFSTRPEVAPEFLAARAKGRLQHAFRIGGTPISFSRKLAVRSIGHNTRNDVQQYVREQVQRAELADESYRENMQRHVFSDPSCDLTRPSETRSGRYWYNLHVVLVVAERYRMGSGETPARIRHACLKTAGKHGCHVADLSVMPDHLHVAMRGNPGMSPQDIALSLMNNTAFALGQVRFWEDGYYVGTFGEYTMSAVR
jgi:REP element-mobilizing transposase RayT